MKHLVLGSSGQLGRPVVNYLRKQGEEVQEFDIRRTLDEDCRIHSDILDRAISECDYCHFLAFDIGGAKYIEKYQDSLQFIDNNMKIMTTVFRILEKYRKPFAFASSQMAAIENNSYGMLKSLGEKMTLDLGGLVTRFWNIYAPENHEDDVLKVHAINDFVRMAKNDRIIKMLTDGTENRQFLWGEDAAECMLILSKKYNELTNRIIDISSFEWVTINRVAQEVANQISTIYPAPEWVELVEGTKKDMRPKNNPSVDVLNHWEPKTTLEEGIKAIIESHK